MGRQDADIELASTTVSRRHARIQIQDGHITLSDLGSTNGTQVNGVPCLPGEVFFVQSGDELQLGDVILQLQLTADDH
jgi:pSer/pThr/pTyr-binding forkhead associated (FHA) protein